MFESYENFDQNNQKQSFTQANLGKRLLNWLLDNLFIYLLILITFDLIIIAGYRDWLLQLVEDMNSNILKVYLLNAAFQTTYYTIAEGMTGSTIGKYITKTKVLTQSGEHISLKKALDRSVCRLLPFEAFSILLKNDGKAWHDSITGTQVVLRTPH
jgi:uncharacterized RDD family membrane protein YckC